tara:strand:+ start:64 stop:1143 length:1080 start_codon:yes stop_codon:yes gene_type:complete
MAITAFSKQLNRELDALQYFSLLGHDIKKDPELNFISDKERLNVKKDITCPSCGVENAIIVSGSKNDKNKAIRQPHFRFLDANGNEAHHEYCDLKTVEAFKDITCSNVSFLSQKSNSELTKLIGEIVSSALTSEIIKVSDMVNLRQWHFNLKKDNISKIFVSSDKLHPYEVYKCRKNLDTVSALNPTIEPESVINKLALDKIVAQNKDTYNKIEQHPDFKIKARDIKSFFKNGSRSVFDVRLLSEQYDLSNKFGHAILNSFKTTLNSQKEKSILQACCALFLYVNKWQIETSIDMFNLALKNRNQKSTIEANIIGFNPFYKYDFYEAILNINDVANSLPTSDELRILVAETAKNLDKKI